MVEVESVLRGLEILKALNMRPTQTLAEVAARAGLTRGTAYRMLFTLEKAGLVERVEAGYRVTQRVRSLSHGYDDNWPGEVARPIVHELGRELLWPITLSQHSHGSALVRETTDRESPFTLSVTKVGYRMSMLDTASGRVLLSYAPPRQQQLLLVYLRHADSGIGPFGKSCCGSFNTIAETIRNQGYDFLPTFQGRQTAIAVPVVNDTGQAVAALALRYFNVAMRPKEALQRFLDPLRFGADRIGARLSQRDYAVH